MNPKQSHDIVLICGGHTNAHTIAKNLSVIGFEGETVIVRNAGDPVLVAERLNPKIRTWELSAEQARNLPEAIAKRWSGHSGKIYVCFTSERYHQSFAQWKRKYSDDNIIVHVGDVNRLSTILDRYEFYQFIEEKNVAAVPKTILGTEDPFAVFGESFVVRPRQTWQTPVRRECVKMVRSQDQYRTVMADFISRGVIKEDLCFQELLCIRNESNVSIAGWFDPDHRHLYGLRKRFQHPPGTGSGDVCECIDPPAGMMDAAVAILTELNYHGPFELEFVFDNNSNQYKVIEMNPRFWMQHGLLEQISGVALLSRYLQREPLPVSSQQTRIKYWVNTGQCLTHLLKFSFKPLAYYFRKDSWAPYSLFQAVRYAPLHVISKMRMSK